MTADSRKNMMIIEEEKLAFDVRSVRESMSVLLTCSAYCVPRVIYSRRGTFKEELVI